MTKTSFLLMAIWNLVRFYHVRDQLLLRLGGLGFLGGGHMVAGGTEGGSVVVNRVQSGGGGAGECRKLSVK